MEGKSVKQTSVVITQVMRQEDVNIAGNVHAGVIMKLADVAAGIVAFRHARRNVVTAAIDHVDFYHPVFVGDLVTASASLNLVGRTSMEIGVRLDAENIRTGEVRHTASAYLTYVALDKERHPVEVPPLILETDEDQRRNREAQARRESRLRERQKRQERQK